MRRHIHQGFVRSVLLGEDTELANFLTFGFAELEFRVRPSRQDLVLALFKGLMEVFLSLKIPVVVAFDQLEDLLLARRTDDGHRVAEAFFAGIVQAMHQIDGLCFLVFAERGLWNRFVPSLDGYIQDRLNNPIHLPRHGTIKALRLEAPPPGLARRVVEARMRPALEELPDFTELPAIYPFNDEQVERIARTEPTLRDMLQQYRHLFDHLVYGTSPQSAVEREIAPAPRIELPAELEPAPSVKSVMVVETPVTREAGRRGKTSRAGEGSYPLTEASPSLGRSNHRQRIVGPGNGRRDDQDRIRRRPHGGNARAAGRTRRISDGLPRAWRESRPLAFTPRGAGMDLRRPPNLWRHQHRPLGLQRRPALESRRRAVLGAGRRQTQRFGDQVGCFRCRAARYRSSDPAPPRRRFGAFRQEQNSLAGRGEKESSRPPGGSATILLCGSLWLPALAERFAEAVPAGQPVPNFADLLQERCEKLLEQVCMPIQG